MTLKTEIKIIKKQYNKPKLEQVKLIAEEAVLAGCKGPVGIPGKNSDPCRQPQCKFNPLS